MERGSGSCRREPPNFLKPATCLGGLGKPQDEFSPSPRPRVKFVAVFCLVACQSSPHRDKPVGGGGNAVVCRLIAVSLWVFFKREAQRSPGLKGKSEEIRQALISEKSATLGAESGSGGHGTRTHNPFGQLISNQPASHSLILRVLAETRTIPWFARSRGSGLPAKRATESPPIPVCDRPYSSQPDWLGKVRKRLV